MSEAKDFLARWSQRKRDAIDDGGTEGQRRKRPPESDSTKQAAGAQTGTRPESRFDPESLPSSDSISSTGDVIAFLGKGVPAELTRAALRRAWITDPAIRDFVGLSENAWDFNDPKAMPGFGPLDQSPDQIRQMAADLFGETRRETDKAANMSETLQAGSESVNHSSTNDSDDPASPANEQATLPSESRNKEMITSDAASIIDNHQPPINPQQNEVPEPAQPQRRTYGRALPQ